MPRRQPSRGGKRRGLATLPTARVREIASMGGTMAHRLRRAHRWTPEEARAQRLAQLERAREQEELLLRLKAKVRATLGPSPGPSKKEDK